MILKEPILNKAEELFYGYGLKTVTMDDIAKASGVSKKTVYESFSDKNEILACVIKRLLQCHQQGLERCRLEAVNAIEEVALADEITTRNITLINQNFFYDLEKSFPDMWFLISEHKKNVLLPGIIQNLHRGIHEEHYRPELKIPFVADLRVQQIMTAFNPKLFNGKMQQGSGLMLQLTEFFLYGISTHKVKKLINKYLNTSNEKQFSN